MSSNEVMQAEYKMVIESSPAGLGGLNFNSAGLKGPKFPIPD